MVFETLSEVNSVLLWSAFAIALVMGALVNKTNFCTMGAVSDWVNMGDTGRLRAWLFAIAVGILGVSALESSGMLDLDATFPPYRMSQLLWAEHLLGGFLFGIGMTLASGCGNKCLIRIGGGNIKSIVVFGVVAVIAFFMINPLPGSDQTLMSLLFLDWIRPLAIDLNGRPQDIASVVAGDSGAAIRIWVALAVAAGLLFYAFKGKEFRTLDNVLGGFVVGAAVVAAWYVSANLFIGYESDFDGAVTVSAREYLDPAAGHWDMGPEAIREGWDKKPDSNSMSAQSFTFINPMGQTLGYAGGAFDKALLTFGVVAVLGVILGSFLFSVLTKGFRIEWFVNGKDFLNHFIGAILMGFGGVLAMGCTIGQGVTGFSTLAVGSIITFVAIIFGSALTMKINYYKLVYEEEATFAKALVTSLVDMKLLPGGLRKLEAV